MYKKLLLPILLFYIQITSTYTVVYTYHYTYSTPLSQSLVMGELSTFLEECKYYKEKDIYFALEEFIRLRPINAREITSPSIKYVLKYLHRKLTHNIQRIENQIKYNYQFDYESLAISGISFSIGAGLNSLAYYYKQKSNNTSFLTLSFPIFGILFLYVSLINTPDIFNPNRDNAYLEKYKKLLKFVKKLQTRNYSHDIDIAPVFLAMFGGVILLCLLNSHR